MPLPDLNPDWTSTRQALHEVARVLGAIRAAVAPPQVNWLHLALRVLPGRLSTGQLAALGEWHFDLRTQTLHWYPISQEPVAVSTRGLTQRTLTDTVLKLLAHDGAGSTWTARGSAGRLRSSRTRTAAAYGDALTAIFEVFERLRAGLPGAKTPLVVWPHGFDLSFLWFPRAVRSEEHPHGLRLLPASEGLERPTSTPIPTRSARPDGATAPRAARWHTAGWTGLVLPV